MFKKCQNGGITDVHRTKNLRSSICNYLPHCHYNLYEHYVVPRNNLFDGAY